LVAIAKVRCVTKSRAKGVVPLHPRERVLKAVPWVQVTV
jgi:hypothetical protein